MRWFGILLIIFVGSEKTGLAQSLTISGRILDALTSRPVATAQVFLKQHNKIEHQLSGENGHFQFANTPAGETTIIVQRLSYQNVNIHFFMIADTSVTIELLPEPLALSEISLSAEKDRRLLLMQRSSQPVLHFAAQEIDEIAAADAADVLTFAPGIFIKNYGGFSGLKTVSLRGAAGTQVKILLDGIEYDNSQSGVTDLSTLDMNAFEAIDLYRGGNAAQFGANALAGVIDLRTVVAGKTPAIKFSTTKGEFGQQSLQFRASGTVTGLQAVTAVSRQNATGNYPFHFNVFGRDTVLSRANADYENFHFLSTLQKKTDAKTTILSFTRYSGRRGVPGAVLQGSFVPSQARQNDEDTQLTGQFSWRIAPDKIWRNALRWRKSDLNYRDPQVKIRPQGIDDFYRNHMLYAQSAFEIIRTNQRFLTKLEAGESKLRSNNLAHPLAQSFEIIEKVQRRFVHATFLWEKNDESGLHFRMLQFALRFSHYSDAGSALSPSMGFNFKPTQLPLHLRLHAAHSFRVPAFAEQYFLNYGNRRLKPEKSLSIESGANAAFAFRGNFIFDASFFAFAVSNQIISIPRSPVLWSAENVGKTRHRGLELLGEWRSPGKRIHLRTTWTRQTAEDRSPGSRTFGKQLVYIPREIFTAIMALEQPLTARLSGQFSLTARRVSYRYHLSENDFDSLLPAYAIIDLKAGIKKSFGKINCVLNLQIENIVDVTYEIIHNYPMPGRIWRLQAEMRSGHAEK